MNTDNFSYHQNYDFCGLWLTLIKFKSHFQSIPQWPQGTKWGFLKNQSEIQMYSCVFWSWEFSLCPSQTEEGIIGALHPPPALVCTCRSVVRNTSIALQY